MSTEQNKTLARQVMTALDDRDLDTVLKYYAPECQFHGWGPETLNTAGYKAAMGAILDAFPDSRFSVEELVAEGERVAIRHTLRGTHQAEFQGIPATGNPILVNAIVIIRFENGKAVELWLNADFMGLIQQLGAVPA